MVALAGALTIAGAFDLDLDGAGDEPDLSRAIDHALELCTERGLRRFMNGMIARCLAILVAHQDDVRRVACALLRRGDLTGEEVAALLERCAEKRPEKEEGPLPA
jgi:hypothetical protein